MLARREVKLFRNGRNRAVRIPNEFVFPGDTVLMHADGDRLILEPKPKAGSLAELLAQWSKEPPLGPDDQFPEIDDPPPEDFDL